MDKKQLITEYVSKFGFPFMITTISLEDDIYIDLMQKAIKRDYALEKEEIVQAFSKVQFDIFQEEQEMTAGEYAQRYSK